MSKQEVIDGFIENQKAIVKHITEMQGGFRPTFYFLVHGDEGNTIICCEVPDDVMEDKSRMAMLYMLRKIKDKIKTDEKGELLCINFNSEAYMTQLPKDEPLSETLPNRDNYPKREGLIMKFDTAGDTITYIYHIERNTMVNENGDIEKSLTLTYDNEIKKKDLSGTLSNFFKV